MPFDATPLTPIAEHLLHAKRLIEKEGWSNDGAWNASGGRCVLTALFDTAPGRWRFASSFRSWPAMRVFEYANDIPSIDTWNDTPGRTLEEVYAAFDRAVALVQSGEGK